MLALHGFPAEHWHHLRTGNPIENVFATLRHRSVRTGGASSRKTAKRVVVKLVQVAARPWRRPKRANRLPQVVQGVTPPTMSPKPAPPDQAASPEITHVSQRPP